MTASTSASASASPTAASPTEWWRSAVIYQVYIRSFRDADGDGIGDVAGIRERLPYLCALGVDALWITPWYPSPMADAGYDVADYRAIEPSFGTLASARSLITEAHALGMRVILDIVPNHTSDQHAWFQAALAAAPGSPERARYMFRAGRGADGAQPPNDWRSVFGGPAWTRVTEADGTPGEWYLHLFAPEQPDLDWEHPEVRAEFESILRFWFDLGVDGFRIDVAHGMIKDPALPDLGLDEEEILAPPASEDHPHWDLDGVHEIYRSWRAIADSYEPPRIFVAEAWTRNQERLARYLRADELHTAFNFDYLRAPWQAQQLRAVIEESIAAAASVDAPPTWVLSNHDVVRHVSRFARPQDGIPRHALTEIAALGAPDLELGTRRARAAALLMLALPGRAYVYQGEELGLPEVEDLPDAALQDPTWERSGHTERGRDGCRVPLPWRARPDDSTGFSIIPATAAPWLPQPDDWASWSEERQHDDPDSMLSLYRTALHIRRAHPVTDTSRLRWLEAPADVIAFERTPELACVVNFGADPVPLPDGAEVLLASAAGFTQDDPPTAIGPDEAIWFTPAGA
ncbi:MAG: alpha-glucosidase [Thermoleophilia bacterium]|nr:alpha-glucosidase [Thermoleophilia bacterium]